MNIKELITLLKENFPNGCVGTDCKNCVLYDTEPDTPENKLCALLSDLTVDYNNWED